MVLVSGGIDGAYVPYDYRPEYGSIAGSPGAMIGTDIGSNVLHHFVVRPHSVFDKLRGERLEAIRDEPHGEAYRKGEYFLIKSVWAVQGLELFVGHQYPLAVGIMQEHDLLALRYAFFNLNVGDEHNKRSDGLASERRARAEIMRESESG